MAIEIGDVLVRVAGPGDVGALVVLRELSVSDPTGDQELETRFARWLALEGDRLTTWLALLSELPIGMASVFEYRRMPRPGRPDSCWGYLGNMSVREEFRNRGVGSVLLREIASTADKRGYARVVLSPSPRSLAFYRRVGFIVPDAAADGNQLFVRPSHMA
jgi:GNAT superfamily N-acetyltransferase